MANFGTVHADTPMDSVLAGASTMILVASKTNVAGNALASINLTFTSGVTITSHLPLYALIQFTSGVLGISVVRIKTTAGYLCATQALITLDATNSSIVIPLGGAVAGSGSITIEITTAGLAASVMSAYVFGVKNPST